MLKPESARRWRAETPDLTASWGSKRSVNLYLNRCRVDTPLEVVELLWAQVLQRRSRVGKVVDFGAGDGRFSRSHAYDQYLGFEVDPTRHATAKLPERASIVQQCAFSTPIADADLCIGNPPYVRNQDLPEGWRQRAAATITSRTGVHLSGLANAWQYFFMLGLAATSSDGLVALLIPYEWVSRPASRELRRYIAQHRWQVTVYRLREHIFRSAKVLTTTSITIVDKSSRTAQWTYLQESSSPNRFVSLPSPSGGQHGVLAYSTRSQSISQSYSAKRGLSPGTQEVLTLTEGERARAGLRIGSDVAPCVTSLRLLDEDSTALTQKVFQHDFVLANRKCWLIRTDRTPSPRLQAYLDSIPPSLYQTATCRQRSPWWKFPMPEAPSLFIASGFRANRPKVLANPISAHAVGSVSGIYGVPPSRVRHLVRELQAINLSGKIVPHSKGLQKVEINQLNTILRGFSPRKAARP